MIQCKFSIGIKCGECKEDGLYLKVGEWFMWYFFMLNEDGEYFGLMEEVCDSQSYVIGWDRERRCE